MGEPVIIWPPGCGNDFPGACEEFLGAGWYDCTFDYQPSGLVCCPEY